MTATTTRLEVTPFEGFTGLAKQGADWVELAAATDSDPVFDTFAWSHAHVRAYTPTDQIFGWTMHAGRQPAALFAFRHEPPRGRLALRRAIHVADGTFDSDYLQPLVRPGFEEESLELLVTELAARRGVDAVVWSGVPAEAPVLAALERVLARRRLPARWRTLPSLVAPLADDFDAYLAGLKPRMRTKVRSALRKAEEGGARFRTCERADELQQRLQDLFRLHQRRWEAAGQRGSFADPRRRDFYATIARTFFDEGALRLVRLDIDARTVACQIGVVAGDAYYQLQEGYEPGRAEDRVGVALRAFAVRALIAEGVRRYEFLAGDARHKRDWGAAPRACRTVAYALPRWRARLAYGLRAFLDRQVAGSQEPG